VHRWSLTLAALALLVAALVPTALAARVHVRIEGKTKTIYGAAEPRFDVGANPMTALDAASARGEFYYHVTQTSFGPYVDQIGRFAAAGSSGWVFKVNGASPPVGADQVQLKDGDRVLWYYATFGSSGGPRTLQLTRQARGCYRVTAQDDQGKLAAARGAVLSVDGRRVRTRNAHACPGPHRGLVRATLAGTVRSNAVK
jgi:hypothetical protein